jgi:photosystem I P700 chlorophyll a apoprotein A2
VFDFIGNVHDIESYHGVVTGLEVNQFIFGTHWGHLAIIFLWLSGTLFHIGWTGNFSYWRINPVSTIAISHSIWDPHFASAAYSSAGTTYFNNTPSFSGVYNWLYSVGFVNELQIYYFVLACEVLALTFLLLGKLHIFNSSSLLNWIAHKTPVYATSSKYEAILPLRFTTTYIDATGIRLNFHLAALIGTFSCLWSGHLVHVSLPNSRGETTFKPSFGLLTSISNGSWYNYMLQNDSPNHVYGSSYGSGKSLLTFIGGLDSTSSSLYVSDMAHHHLAIGILFIWAGHLYSSLYKGIGHRISDIVSASGLRLVVSFINKSLHLQLSLALIFISLTTNFVSQVMYSLPAYPYLAYDYVSVVSLFVHHNWIASLIMVGSFSHGTLFLIRDYTRSGSNTQDVISRLISHKASIISHLSWASLFLGFHTLGLYIHNDSVVAFGEPYKQLLIEPFIAQNAMNLVSFTSKSYGVLGTSLFDLTYINSANSLDLQASTLGPGDFLAYHSISLGLHVTTLILLKGALDSQGSFLMPDKVQFGFGFACDGPARGGTCDISSWDSFYLALFWALNSNSWLMFYFHWKHLLLWQSMSLKFEESSTFLNGWFRDYLWFNSASLIRGYDAAGANDISVWAWTFLAAHLCWATGFMFLISWRGYWQELIDTIIYMHLKTPFLYDLWSGNFYSPVALSIVQARFIGLVHFASGLIVTYAAFVLGATS